MCHLRTGRNQNANTPVHQTSGAIRSTGGRFEEETRATHQTRFRGAEQAEFQSERIR